MKIEHSAHGQRRIETVHNGRRVVSTGGHRGYMERPYLNRGGRAYVQRTYYVGGRSDVYAYRTYYYGGAPYYGYAPAYYLPARLLRMGLQPPILLRPPGSLTTSSLRTSEVPMKRAWPERLARFERLLISLRI